MPVAQVNGVELYWEQRGSGPAISYIGHRQMNSSGPLGGSGQAHHRKSCECVEPPPPRDRIGSVGSDSPRSLPLATSVPSESSKLKNGTASGSVRL